MPRRRNDVPDWTVLWTHITDKAMPLLGWVSSPRQSYRWLRFCHAHPGLRKLALSSACLLSKIHRPYFADRLNCSERVDLLIQHYDFVLRSGFEKLLSKAAKHPFILSRFRGKSGEVYHLELSTAGCRNDEGEWTIRLVSAGICIYSAFVLFVIDDEQPAVKIGGLRGILSTNKANGIRQVTRDLFGCRPKDLMVLVVQAIGGQAGCKRVLLIGNQNKLPRNEKRVCKKSSDYDRTWQELQASARASGDFELPCIRPAEVEAGYFASSRNPLLMPLPLQSILLDTVLQRTVARLQKENSTVRHAYRFQHQVESGREPVHYRAFEIAE